MATQTEEQSFATIDDLAQELRNIDKTKIVIFANNGTGKTRLSVAFKDLGKIAARGDTLYYNAYTEDLFYWDNDLDNDTNRELHLNLYSHFFDGLNSEEMATRIRPILRQYVDFDFDIQLGITRKDQNGNEYTANYITFKRQEFNEQKGYSEWSENIKISRGEENIFKWCFFVAIAQLALNNTDAYSWVKNIFIDDPISSLDDDHAIAVANHLAGLIKQENNDKKIIVTTHHGLFYNVIFNEFRSIKGNALYCLYKTEEEQEDVTKSKKYKWILKDSKDTPFFYHIALIKELNKAVESKRLYAYHFNMLRDLLEKTAAFHGYKNFSKCITKFDNDPDEALFSRMVNIMSHGNYSLFEPKEMGEENKKYFIQIYTDFKKRFSLEEIEKHE